MKNQANRKTADRPRTGGKSGGRVKSSAMRPSPAAAEDRSRKADRQIQSSSKQGLESGSQKEDKMRAKSEPPPASTPVPGAFGKTGSLSEIEEEMVHPEEDADSERQDFLAARRRQNKRASK